MTLIQDKFHSLEDALNDELYERRQEIHTAMVAIAARKHHFQIGPPGTAKSLLVERIAKRVSGMDSDGYFRWLLTNFTSPEELFGGPDFNLLRERGIYKRVTEGKAPRAILIFMDEIFKANSSILNTNLTLMNERKFFNADDDSTVPLVTMFAASNELPSGDALWALWDRLHFRHEIRPMQESGSFINMLSRPMVADPEPLLSLDDIYTAHAAVDSVKMPSEIYEAMKSLRDDLRSDGIEVTERRWVESVSIVRAEAFMNGREEADIEDMRPLMHVLWSDLDHQKVVKKRVLELANPIDKAASDILDDLLGLEADFKEIIADGDNPKAIAKGAIEIQNKVMKNKGKINDLRAASEDSGRKSEYLAEAQAKFKQLAKSVMNDGFGVDPDEINN